MLSILEYIKKTKTSDYAPVLNNQTKMSDIMNWLLREGYTQMDIQNGIYKITKTLMSYDTPAFILSTGEANEMWEGEYLYIYNGRGSHLLEITNITDPKMKSLHGTQYKWINDRGIFQYTEKDYDIVNNYITSDIKVKR